MKTLFLLRHAKSSWDHPNLTDAQRPLNKRGQRDAPMIASRMAEKWPSPEQVICSTALRAQETAAVMKKYWWKKTPVQSESSLYDDSVAGSLKIIHDANPTAQSLALVFHNPTITFLANSLGSLDIDNIPTCGIVILRSETKEWEEISAGCCELIDFDFPKRDHPTT